MKTIDKIKEYYKTDKLEVLDNGKTFGEFKTYHYSAVSLDYIHEYLFKKEVSKKYIAKTLFILCKNEILRPIPCDFANKLLFIRFNFYRNSFCKFKIENNKIINPYYHNQKYNSWIEEFNNFLKN